MNAPLRLDRSRLDAALAAIPREHRPLIGGAFVDVADGRTLSRVSPARGVPPSAA